jgi:hypothetical protein
MISSAASKAMRVAKAAAFYAVVLGVLVALVLVAAGNKAEAAFPGKNGKIAFTSYRDGNYEIYRMGADGGSPLRLTYVSDNLSPSWQPLPQGSLQQ